MEAAKLKKTKGTISKGKIKKSLKNVICRPDPAFWPAITDTEKNALDNILQNYRVHIPSYKKPHWDEIKLMTKSERPKAPPIRRVDGLLFGLSECYNSIQNGNCSAVIIEGLMNPQSIVESCINACVISNVPVVCLENLKILSRTYFGIRTSCLGVKKDSLIELSNKIMEISVNYKPKRKEVPKNSLYEDIECIKNEDLAMEVDTTIVEPYLYRKDKKSRVFVPSNIVGKNNQNQFVGLHYIKLSENAESKADSKAYMRMMLKKISNNPKRVKLKQKS